MALSEDQLKTLILQEVGRSGDSSFSALLDLAWDLYAPFGQISLLVQFAYVKRHAIYLAMGDVIESYDTQALNIVEKESQKFDHYFRLIATTDALITSYERMFGFDDSYLYGVIQKATPVEYQNILWNPNRFGIGGNPSWLIPTST